MAKEWREQKHTPIEPDTAPSRELPAAAENNAPTMALTAYFAAVGVRDSAQQAAMRTHARGFERKSLTEAQWREIFQPYYGGAQ